ARSEIEAASAATTTRVMKRRNRTTIPSSVYRAQASAEAIACFPRRGRPQTGPPRRRDDRPLGLEARRTRRWLSAADVPVHSGFVVGSDSLQLLDRVEVGVGTHDPGHAVLQARGHVHEV